MRLATLSLTAFASTILAQSDNTYTTASQPFRLFLKSSNGTLDGTALGACHQGAAIEGLCLTTQRASDAATWYTTYTHNVSSTAAQNAIDTPGILAFSLHTSGDQVFPSSMYLSIVPTSNVAIPIIKPGYDTATTVEFDDAGAMYIAAYENDFASPPEGLSPPWKVREWYVCLTHWAYLYTTLVWKVGIGNERSPQNPSCQKVEVIRVYV